MLVLLILVVFVINASNAVPLTLDYIIWDCYNSTTYPPNSSYETNLNHLLSTLAPQTSNSKHGFFTTKLNTTQNQDHPVYGLASCRGDINPNDCRDCVRQASTQVIRACPEQTQAVFWMEQCMLRYSNRSFSHLLQESPNKVRFNTHNVTNNVNDWIKLLNDTLIEVTSKAASDKSGNKFATKRVWFSPSQKYLYTLAQCNPDLTVADCAECFSLARSQYDGMAQRGGLVLTPSCNIRYQVKQFYGENSNYSITPLPTLSLPPPPNHHISTITYTGKKKQTTNVVVAIVVPIVILGVLISFSTYFYTKKAKKRRSLDLKNVLDDLTTAESLMFELEILEAATNNFAFIRKLGQGGFGSVYK
ncbi:hypothetical protein SOVF_171760, partial [Spinacia oleracea]